MDLGTTQEDVANALGLHEMTVNNWETNRTEPALRLVPRIIDFLGFAPYSTSKSLPERLSACRRSLGLSQKKLAKVLGVNESSIRTWESGRRKASSRCVKIIENFLADNKEVGGNSIVEPRSQRRGRGFESRLLHQQASLLQ